MTRRKRQSLKRVRDDIAALERRCARLMRELSDAEHAFRRAWENEQRLEDQNRRLMEMLTRVEMLKPPAPIIIELPDGGADAPGEGR